MKNWLKKVLSLLTAIAMLISCTAVALAENGEELTGLADAEEVVLNAEPTTDAPAQDDTAEAPAEGETSYLNVGTPEAAESTDGDAPAAVNDGPAAEEAPATVEEAPAAEGSQSAEADSSDHKEEAPAAEESAAEGSAAEKSEEGTSEEGASEEGSDKRESSESESSEEEASEEGSADQESSEEEASTEGTSEEGSADQESSESESSEEEASEEGSADQESSESESSEEEASEEGSEGQESSESKSSEEEAPEEGSEGQESSESKSSEEGASEEGSEGQESSDDEFGDDEFFGEDDDDDEDPFANLTPEEIEAMILSGEIIVDEDGFMYLVDDLSTFEEGDLGSADIEQIEAQGLVMTSEVKFSDIPWLNLGDSVFGSIDALTKAEYLIKWNCNRAVVLSLNASSKLNVTINGDYVSFEQVEGTENDPGFSGTYKLNIIADCEYNIILTSSEDVFFTLTVNDAYVAPAEENIESEEIPAEENTEEEIGIEENGEYTEAAEGTEGEGTYTEENIEGTFEGEGNEDIYDENNTDDETIEEEAPVINGWITFDTKAFHMNDTITLRANSDVDLGEGYFWQTKDQGGEWAGLGYGSTWTVVLDRDNINNSFRFKMEGENFSDEFQLGTIQIEEEAEPVIVAEPVTDETVEETEEVIDEPVIEGNEAEADEAEAEGTEDTTEAEGETAEEAGEEEIKEEVAEGADAAEEEGAAGDTAEAEESEAEVIEEKEEVEEEQTEEPEQQEEAEEVIENEENKEEAEEEKAEEIEEKEEVKEEESEDEETKEETEEEEETEEVKELTEEQLTELGYSKVQITNPKGTDVFADTKEDSEAIDHLDPETELWIKDTETEGWAKIYTKDEEKAQYIKVADLEKKILTDEEMLEMGYAKVTVIMNIGADVYAKAEESSEVIEHLATGTEMWVKIEEGSRWAAIYSDDEEKTAGFVNLVDLAALLLPEKIADFPIRTIVVTSSQDESPIVIIGEEVVLTAQFLNFEENDDYTITWQYTPDHGETYEDIDDANEETFTYTVGLDNLGYGYRIVVTLQPKE